LFRSNAPLYFKQSLTQRRKEDDNDDDDKKRRSEEDIVDDEDVEKKPAEAQGEKKDESKALPPAPKTRSYSSAVQAFFSAPTPPFVEVVPLFKKPVFPGIVFPIVVHDPQLVNSLLKSGAEDKLVGLFLVKEEERSKEGTQPVKDVRQIENVGVLAKIVRAYTSKFGASVIFAVIRRISITGVVDNPEGRLTVKIQELKDVVPTPANNTYVKAYVMEIVSCLKELANLNSFYKEQLTLFIDQVDFSNPSDLADVAALLTTPDANKLQDVLSTTRVDERLRKALELLKMELETIRIQSKIQKNLDEKISATQRKFYLNEQLKLIKKELGLEHDEKETLIQKYNERLQGKTVPEAAEKVIKEEMAKLQTLEPSSSEYNVCRNYLDWLTILPWGVHQEEKFDLKHAQKVLDEDHFGLRKLKERILEFIAVGKLKGSVVGKIICFVGPPGTGKTSIGKSIARALGREFYRFSVGGMSDVAEIKGHRRTYVGAMPGKLIQVLKQSKSANPVIMIDEIDKLGKGHGDPASALLEVLDPEQNSSFLDHYLDVPVDLSKVFGFWWFH
jgi:endopeptidase La